MLFGLFTILPFTVCLFWATVFLLDWRRDNAAQHVLAIFMIASAALYFCHAVFFNHVQEWSAVSECIYAFCNIGVFPLYYLYICRLTDRRGLSIRNFAALLPTMIIGLWAIALEALCPDDVAAEKLRIMVMRIVFMVQLVPICWICYRKLKRFDNEIANAYADTERRSVRPISRIMGVLIGAALISGAANFLGREYFDSSELLIAAPSVAFTALLFGVGYVGKRQIFSIDNLIRDENRREAPEIGGSSVEIHDEIADNAHPQDSSQTISSLATLMAETKVYLKPDLRLSEVAAMLGVGRSTLSQRMNREMHISFSDYVNNLRIEYACRLLADFDGKKMTLSVIAEMCGFSSDSSFYRAFRRHTGMTPKQYLESR